MSTDTRRFICHDWKLLEVPNRLNVRLTVVWRDRFGYVPPFSNGAVAGWSFTIKEGRAVVITKPDSFGLFDSAQAQLFALLAAKHGVDVRLATDHEIPVLGSSELIPSPADLAAVEEYPAPTDSPVVVEFGLSGRYVGRQVRSDWTLVNEIDSARVFDSLTDADEWIDSNGQRRGLVLRYQAAVLAEHDQREAAWLADGMA